MELDAANSWLPGAPGAPKPIAGFKSVAGRSRRPGFGPEEQAGRDAGAVPFGTAELVSDVD